MIYAATKGVILYWNPEQPSLIHRAHHVWFNKYISCPFIEYKHTPGSLLIQQYPKILIHNTDLLNLIPC